MLDRIALINKLRNTENELNRLNSGHNPRFSMSRSTSYNSEVSHNMMQNIGVIGVFLLIGLFIGYALKKR